MGGCDDCNNHIIRVACDWCGTAEHVRTTLRFPRVYATYIHERIEALSSTSRHWKHEYIHHAKWAQFFYAIYIIHTYNKYYGHLIFVFISSLFDDNKLHIIIDFDVLIYSICVKFF